MIRVAKLTEAAILPQRKHPSDAGMDLFYSGMGKEIPPGQFAILNTGITVEIPEGMCGFIWPKSRNDHLIGGGVVDAGYQGEVLVKIANYSSSTLVFKYGDPIAQMVISPVFVDEVEECSRTEIHRTKTDRGATGGIVHQTSFAEIVQGPEQY